MSALGNYLETKLYDHVLRNTSYTSPTTVYAALFVSPTAGDLEAGTLTSEVSGGSYARTAVTFGASTNGSGSNSGAVTFPTASGSWGTITEVAIMDASTSGNVLYHGTLSASVTIASGDTFKFNIGQLVCSMA